jgi:predicted NAD/FAD-dependent oxidoreductase
MAGLFAARTLHVEACKSTILEKSRGVGGRLASRRIGDLTFDHGAQHIQARSAEFRVYVQAAEQTRVLRHWTSAFPDVKGNQQQFPSPVLRGHPAITAFPKRIAFDLLIHLQQRVTSARINNGAWSVETESGHIYMAQALVLTAPIPQSLGLLEAGDVTLPSDVARQLQAVVYAPCIVLMIGLDDDSGIEEPGGLILDGEPLSWMADNHTKGVSPSPGALTVFAGERFSMDHLAAPDDAIVSELLPHVRRIVPATVRTVQVHRWRYARPKTYLPIPFAVCCTEPPLLFAGDVFGLGDAEGAALSGIAAAEFLHSTFCPRP